MSLLHKTLIILRQLKRAFLTRGFAKTVNEFLKEVERGGDAHYYPAEKHLINLSFDFEFGLGTTFWDGDIQKALSYGKTSRINFVPIMKYLAEEKIPANVQVVGALFDQAASSLDIFNNEQREVMLKNKELFSLTPEDINLLKTSNIEVGVHGFSHRHFTNLSSREAEYEMNKAISNFEKVFGKRPEFMAFPKNRVAHTDIIQKYGIKCWRADTEHPQDILEIPLGHWFAPGVLDSNDLEKLLSVIRNTRKGFFLHLWGHFTEMDVETFRKLVEVIEDSGWKFTTVKNFKKY